LKGKNERGGIKGTRKNFVKNVSIFFVSFETPRKSIKKPTVPLTPMTNEKMVLLEPPFWYTNGTN